MRCRTGASVRPARNWGSSFASSASEPASFHSRRALLELLALFRGDAQADTGSLQIWGRPDGPRRHDLLPPRHHGRARWPSHARACTGATATLSFGRAGVVHRILDAYAQAHDRSGVSFEQWVRADSYDPVALASARPTAGPLRAPLRGQPARPQKLSSRTGKTATDRASSRPHSASMAETVQAILFALRGASDAPESAACGIASSKNGARPAPMASTIATAPSNQRAGQTPSTHEFRKTRPTVVRERPATPAGTSPRVAGQPEVLSSISTACGRHEKNFSIR